MGGFLPRTWVLPALVTLAAAAFRPPCVPLDVATPYQSTWSCSSEAMGGWSIYQDIPIGSQEMGYRMDIVEYSTGSYLILVYFEIMTLILELIFSNNNSIIVISQDIATWNVWMMGLGQHGAFFRE